jgi:hypothetical protein
MNEPHIVSNYLSTGLRARLARWIGGQPTTLEMVEAIGKMSAAIDDLARESREERATLTGLIEQVDRLEKQAARTGKEQYKTNLLSETQQQSVKEILEQLRQTDAYRDRELAALRDQVAGARIEGRLEVAEQLFPVIDGLDEALASGTRWLEPGDARGATALRGADNPVSFFGRLFGQSATHAQSEMPPEAEVQNRLRSWLTGLDLVRERLLELLAAQGIFPIETEGEAFDPHWHVAVETTPPAAGQAQGQIIRTQRRGFRRGEAAIRYAEVVVTREPSPAAQTGSEGQDQ